MKFTENVVSMEQFTTGMVMNFQRLYAERDWEDWYHGRYQSLLPSVATIQNGLAMFDNTDLIEVPFFKEASDIYIHAVLADNPVLDTDSPEMQEWWDEHQDTFLKVLRKAVQQWSIKDRMVMVTLMDGSVLEIDPTEYFRVGRLEDSDELVGHVLAIPYYDFNAADLQNPAFMRIPNRIQISRYSEGLGINDVQQFDFSGSLVIGKPITGREPGDITSLVHGGMGDSWYGHARTLVGRLMIQTTNLDVVVNQTNNKTLVIPTNISFGMRTGEGDTRTIQQLTTAYRKIVRPAVQIAAGTDPATADVGVIDEAYAVAEQQGVLEHTRQLCYLATELPPSVHGYGIGAAESGVAIERRNDRATARVAGLRNAIMRGFPKLFKGMGAPEAEFHLSWRTAPFENRSEYEDRVLRLYNSKVISLELTQKMLGIEPHDIAQAQQEDTPGSGGGI